VIHQEAVILTRYVRAMCPQQKFDEYTADAWHNILNGYSLDEARTAVDRHITAGHAFVAVGEIITEIRKARNDRLERHTEAEPPAGDTGDHAYRAALIAERRAIAAGYTEPRPVPALPPGSSEQPGGRARAVLAAIGSKIPAPRDGAVNVMAVACPHCHARPGRGCTASNGRRRLADPHFARLEDARRAAAGQPAATREDTARELEHRRAAAAAAIARLDTRPEPADDFDPIHRTRPKTTGQDHAEETAAS
jgi:hypothetical protein